jgi:hypothetical protein
MFEILLPRLGVSIMLKRIVLITAIAAFIVLSSACGLMDNQETTTPTTSTTAYNPVKDVDQTVELGTKLVVSDFFEMTAIKINFTQLIEPPDPADWYHFYKVHDADKTYLEMIVEYKNLRTAAISASEAASVTFFFDEHSGYAGKPLIEETDGSDFPDAKKTMIEPMMTRTIHYFSEIDVKYQKESLRVDAVIGVNKRHYNICLKP